MGLSFSKTPILADAAAFATRIHSENEDDQSKWKKYDFVIVGGGTAGITLASRLSEDSGVTVLLIEAGQSHEGHFPSRIPFTFNANFKRHSDWDYLTVPQHDLENRELYFPRGKLLGGCSSISVCIYHRCSPEDFDLWENNGAEGWGYRDLLPYFKKSEGYWESPTGYRGVNLEDRGRNGPWKVTHIDQGLMNDVLLETCSEIGIPRISDFNTDKGTLGASTFSRTVDEKGNRSSVATAYLTPSVLARPNLTIGSPPARRRLSSLKWEHRKYFTLWHWACGPSPRNGIEVVKDLNHVGKNLVEHLTCGPLSLRTKPAISWNHLLSPLSGLKAFMQWYILGSGPLRTLVSPGAAFVRSDYKSLPYEARSGQGVIPADITAGTNSPDIEIIWFPTIVLDSGHAPTPKGVEGITLSAIALKPSSSGQVLLKTSSIWDKPAIDANPIDDWLIEQLLFLENDFNVIVRGTRLIMKLIKTEPLASYVVKEGSSDYDFLWPGHANPDGVTDAQIKDWIRKNGVPAWHPTSSARMGTSESNSVVDTKLRVHGMEGLRIVDASVFPTQVSGHTTAVVVAMAEKAADMIRAGL
ncbi:GMC oxidoreductase [Cyathus striatus]|nr:GMC oxidoreductase [Cyathus striatus]